MSFWLFLALVPLAAVAGLLAARFVTARPWLAETALSAVPARVRALLVTQVQLVAAWHGGTVASVATGMFLWLAASGIHSVFDALEVQTGTCRPWWKKRLLAIATCVALSLGVALVALLSVGFEWSEAIAGNALPPAVTHAVRGPIGSALRWAAGMTIGVGMIAGLYRVGIPREARAHTPILPGAILAAALQALFGWAFGFYVTRLGGGGDAYQAGLAVIGTTLVTLWLFSFAVLLGAELNRIVAERLRRRGTWQRPDASSSPRTSPRPRTEPSTGPSSSPPLSTHP
jgi:membrane protein